MVAVHLVAIAVVTALLTALLSDPRLFLGPFIAGYEAVLPVGLAVANMALLVLVALAGARGLR